jgi:hypothetical protein
VSGVWRRDLSSGAIEQVAGGAAELPSLSEDGRYISFTTNEGASLAAETNSRAITAQHAEAVNVYVRDMEVAPEEPGAFSIASAPDGSSQPLTYSAAGTTLGAAAVGRTAISADGNEVAFVTTAVSDLTDPGSPSAPTTPAYQVAVRYLSTEHTKLISTDRATGGPVSGSQEGIPVGGVYPSAFPAFRQVPPYMELGQGEPPGASISADGSTVAWMGDDIAAQVQMLPAESPSALYTEPLWRRIEPGSETPTERVTGGSDPSTQACQEGGESALAVTGQAPTDPCLGPFIVYQRATTASVGIWVNQGGAAAGIGDFVPRLSADGYDVAFLSEALPKTASASLNGVEHTQGEQADVYRVDMHPGLTRDQAITPITELAGTSLADDEPINEFAISADGAQIAFTTRRTVFPLGSLALVSTPAPEPGLNELFDADLGNGTLARVTQGYEGGVSEQPHIRKPEEDPYGGLLGAGAASPAFSSSGNELVFASTASNLAFGDGNTPPGSVASTSTGAPDGSDAFVVERLQLASIATPQYISPAPQTDTQPAWTLGVTAASMPDGSVRLYALVPGAGTLGATAAGVVPVRSAVGREASKRAGSRGRARHRGGARAARRTVAKAQKSVPDADEVVTVALRLARPYAALAATSAGVSAMVTVTFTAPGHPTLTQSIPVTFKRRVKGRAGHGTVASRGSR